MCSSTFESPEEEEAAVEHIREELESSVADARFNQSYEEGVITEDFTRKPISGTKKPKRNDFVLAVRVKNTKVAVDKAGPKKDYWHNHTFYSHSAHKAKKMWLGFRLGFSTIGHLFPLLVLYFSCLSEKSSFPTSRF